VSRRALLWRREDERVEWYPLGRLAADTALYVGAVSLAALAQGLLARSGHARRPTPALGGLVLPSWVVPVTLGALVVGRLSDGAPAFAANLVLLLSGALLFLAGLAVLHALVAARRLGRAPLVFVYVLLVLFSWPLVAVVAVLGLAEELVGLRRRLA